jgi:hypothetical protein
MSLTFPPADFSNNSESWPTTRIIGILFVVLILFFFLRYPAFRNSIKAAFFGFENFRENPKSVRSYLVKKVFLPLQDFCLSIWCLIFCCAQHRRGDSNLVVKRKSSRENPPNSGSGRGSPSGDINSSDSETNRSQNPNSNPNPNSNSSVNDKNNQSDKSCSEQSLFLLNRLSQNYLLPFFALFCGPLFVGFLVGLWCHFIPCIWWRCEGDYGSVWESNNHSNQNSDSEKSNSELIRFWILIIVGETVCILGWVVGVWTSWKQNLREKQAGRVLPGEEDLEREFGAIKASPSSSKSNPSVSSPHRNTSNISGSPISDGSRA